MRCINKLLTSKRLDIEVKDVHFDKCGRRILINCNIQNENFTLVGIYAPNKISPRRDFINNLSSWVTQHATFESNLILLGDLNTISKKEDRTSGRPTLDPVTENLLAVKSNLAITDVWSALNNTENNTASSHHCRIDYNVKWLLVRVGICLQE